MIVDIQKGGFIRGLIEYHEKKVKEGKAQLFFDNTLSENAKERVSTFVETSELNTKIRKNKFMHISVSFNLNDRQIDQDIMQKIGEKYLDEMGIKDTPVLMYEHSDKRHRHFHIVTTCMDYNGRKIPDFNDHYRSQLLSRKIEAEFGLETTKYQNSQHNGLQELNASKYKIYNALKEIGRIPGIQNEFRGALPDDLQAEIAKDQLADPEITKKLLQRGIEKDSIDHIYRVLTKHNLVKKSIKQDLIDRLNQLRMLSKNRDEFLQRAENAGIYVRKIATANNGYTLTYGLPDQSFYVKEKDLPAALRHDFLYTGKKLDLTFDKDKQRSYLKRIVDKARYQAKDLSDFERILIDNGVRIEYATNARGVYGVSFSSENVLNAETFKGSELDRSLSWNSLARHFNLQPAEINIEPSADVAPSGPTEKPYIPNLSKFTDNPDDEETKKRRKKNDQDQDLERE